MINRDKLRLWKIVLDAYIEVFCDLVGDAVNAIIKKGISGTSFDPNSLAATVGVLLDIYEDGRVPRRYKCIDFVKALGVERDYDEEYIYGKPSLESLYFREKSVIPVIEDLFGRSSKIIRKYIYEKIGDPDKVIEIASTPRRLDPRLISYEIHHQDDVIAVTLCYDDPEIVEALANSIY